MSASAIAAIGAALRNVVSRGKLTLTVWNPTRPLMVVTGLAGETKQNVELIMPYGMSARPAAGGDIVMLQVMGTRDHLIAFLDDPALRILDLEPGEFGLRDVNGQQLVFRTDHFELTTPLKIVMTVGGDLDATVSGAVNLTAGGTAVITAPLVEIAGTGGKKVVLDGDPVVGGVVHATSTKTTAI